MIRSLLSLILLFFICEVSMAQQSAYDFSFTTIDGKSFPLSQFKGKYILVVNTASNCGFTKQYKDLENLWNMYKDRNLVVIAVPSNDFGSQEPGTNEEIKSFCETKFNITFPIMSKERVIGDEAHPFYKWASSQTGMLGSPKWNFHKFLIGPNGEFIDFFISSTNPTSQAITSAIGAE